MTTVQTVTGPVDGADLGRTLVHEHIRISYDGESSTRTTRGTAPTPSSVRSTRWASCSTPGSARSSTRARSSSDATRALRRDRVALGHADRVHHRLLHRAPRWGLPVYWRARDPEEIAELYVKELTDGIANTGGIRAGAIKAATGTEVTGGRVALPHRRRDRAARGGLRHHHAHRELAARRRAAGPLRRRWRRPRPRAHRSPGRADRRRADPQARRAGHVRRHRPHRARDHRPRRAARRPRRRARARGLHVAGVPLAGPHLRAHRTAALVLRAARAPRGGRGAPRADLVAGVAAAVHLHRHRLRAQAAASAASPTPTSRRSSSTTPAACSPAPDRPPGFLSPRFGHPMPGASDQSRPTSRCCTTRHRAAMLALAAVLALDGADRTALGALAPALMAEFSIGNAAIGLLASAFAIVGAHRRSSPSASSPTAPGGSRSSSCASASGAWPWASRRPRGRSRCCSRRGSPSACSPRPEARRSRRSSATCSRPTCAGGCSAGSRAASWWARVPASSWRASSSGSPRGAACSPCSRCSAWWSRGPSRACPSRVVAARTTSRATRSAASTRPSQLHELVEEQHVEAKPELVLEGDQSELADQAAMEYVFKVKTVVMIIAASALGDVFFTALQVFGVLFLVEQFGISRVGGVDPHPARRRRRVRRRARRWSPRRRAHRARRPHRSHPPRRVELPGGVDPAGPGVPRVVAGGRIAVPRAGGRLPHRTDRAAGGGPPRRRPPAAARPHRERADDRPRRRASVGTPRSSAYSRGVLGEVRPKGCSSRSLLLLPLLAASSVCLMIAARHYPSEVAAVEESEVVEGA